LQPPRGATRVGGGGAGERAGGGRAAALGPDVVMRAVGWRGMDGLEATGFITAATAPTQPKVVMLTTFDLDDYVYEALRAGASGFLLKDSPRADLIAAVRAAAAGDALLAPSVTRRLIEASAPRQPEPSPAPSRLASHSPRRQAVAALLRQLPGH